MTESIQMIVNLIPYGKDNAVRRKELRRITNLPDRQIRKLIEEAKNRGQLIAASPAGGYYRIESADEANDYFAMERAKARSIFRNLSTLQENIRKTFPDNVLPELNLEYAE